MLRDVHKFSVLALIVMAELINIAICPPPPPKRHSTDGGEKAAAATGATEHDENKIEEEQRASCSPHSHKIQLECFISSTSSLIPSTWSWL
jgi:hypothetical protein